MENTFDFAKELTLEGKAKRTVEEYCRRVRLWYRFLVKNGVVDIFEASREHVLAYRGELLAQGMNARTVNVKLSAVSIYYDLAVTKSIITINPVPKGLYIKAKLTSTGRLIDDELRLFEGWIDLLQENLRAAFWCMYGTGARVGEITRLKYTDITLEHGMVMVNIRDAKWGSDRKIPIMNDVAARIVYGFKMSQGASNHPIFHVSKRTLQTYATTFADRTGIPFHCHVLRHTFATRLVEAGVPQSKVQHLLGHKSPGMTLHYIQNAEFDLTSYAPRIEPTNEGEYK